jgi:hypothetical protein
VCEWLLAGDRERAVALARRHEAFEVAVRKLEVTQVSLARELRLEWAATLAARGAYGAAADAIWPVEAERERARHWLERAIARGGISGARALARKLSLVDEDRPATLQQIAAILASEDVERASERKTLVDTVNEAWPAGPVFELAAALRLGVRALVRDAAHSGVMTGRDLDALARRTGDLALRTDLPPAPQDYAMPWPSSTDVLTHVVEAHDVGTSTITDAAMLHGGTLALALGESGCILLAPNGKVLARLAEPAHRLVISDDLESALALAPRGESWRVARFDFAARTASVWRDVRIEEFAESYDGATWFVTTENELHAVDTTRREFESVWYNPDVPGATHLARSPRSLALLAGKEVWRYEVPSYTLRMRTPVEVMKSTYLVAPRPDGTVLEARWAAGVEEVSSHVRVADRIVFATIDGRVSDMLPSEEWIAWIGRSADGAEITLVHPRTLHVRVTVKMRNSFARARLQPGRLVVFDGQGRVVVVDLERGAVIRDLRI